MCTTAPPARYVGLQAAPNRHDVHRHEPHPVDLILSASLLSRPLPSIEDWDLHAGRQIELLLHGLRAGT